MRINDVERWSLVPSACCYDFGITEAIVLGISVAVSATASIVGATQQAAAQRQQAENARMYAAYNAQIAAQNNQVAYQMALYQAQYGQTIAAMNQQMAMRNAQLSQLQAQGARQQYEQGLANAKQLQIQAEATRLQGEEAQRRKREENERAISGIRAKYGASGVTFEGSPLVVLADAARLGESAVQDIAYATELQSRKELRMSEIEKFKASFSLIEEFGHNVEAQNLQIKAQQFGYESQLYQYDSAIAGAKYRIGLNESRLVALGGEMKASEYESAATGSLISGYGAAASSIAGGATQGISNYGYATGKLPYRGVT